MWLILFTLATAFCQLIERAYKVNYSNLRSLPNIYLDRVIFHVLQVCLAVYLSYVFFLRMHSGCSYYYACQDKLCKEFTGKAAKLQCASLLGSAQNCPHSHIHRSAETLHQHTSSKHGFARRTTHDSHAHSLAIDQLV